MDLALLGVNVLLLILVWRFMLRKTILDNSRDKLFDLRDEVRTTFIKNGWDLSSPIYKKLRDLLNGHLRFTEEFSIWKIIFLDVSIKHNRDLQSQLHAQVEKVFASSDLKQKEFIETVRRKAVVAVMDFAVYSSGLLLLIALIVAPLIAAGELIKLVNRGVDVAGKACGRSLSNFGKAASTVMSSSSQLIANRLFVPDLFESYSYRMGSA